MSGIRLDDREAEVLRVLRAHNLKRDGLSSRQIMWALPEHLRGNLGPFGQLLTQMSKDGLMRHYRQPSRVPGSNGSCRAYRITHDGEKALRQHELRR